MTNLVTQTQTAMSDLSLRKEGPPLPYGHTGRPQGGQSALTLLKRKLCERYGNLTSTAPNSCWRRLIPLQLTNASKQNTHSRQHYEAIHEYQLELTN